MSTKKTEASIVIGGDQNTSFDLNLIMSITISKEINKIPTATVVLKDGQANEQSFDISNQDLFKPGNPIEVQLGDPQTKTTVFKGIITRHGVKVRKDKPSLLIVECKDEAVRLTIGRKSRFWNKLSDSDIMKEILGAYSQLQSEVEDTNAIVTHPQLAQYYATDWDFIALRSEALGLYVIVDDGKVAIKKPALSATPNFTLSYGEAGDSPDLSRIWELELDMEARYQFKTINTMGWDPSKQELTQGSNSFTAPSEAGDIMSDELTGVLELDQYHLHHHARMEASELGAFANAVKQKSVLNKTRGRLKFDGRADVKPGDIVALKGVGNRFNGNVYVARVHHEFSKGRWFTTIQVGLPYCWFYENHNIDNPPAIGMLPSIRGLHIGKVLKLVNANQPDLRINVNIPGVHQKDEGVWARMSAFHAGNNRGAVFLPEIGDEVVVGYIGQDVREPVILGSLYSENNPPPLENNDDNFKKGIVTKSGNSILIDDENKIITITTPASNQLILDDQGAVVQLKDSNGNELKMSASGIELKSSAKISIDATEVTVKGTTVDINGTASTAINHPGPGVVKLALGARAVAAEGDPLNLATTQILLPLPVKQVLI